MRKGPKTHHFNQTLVLKIKEKILNVRSPEEFAFMADYVHIWHNLQTEASCTQTSPHYYSYGASAVVRRFPANYGYLQFHCKSLQLNMMSCPYKNRLFRKLTVMSYCIFTAALTINNEFWLFGRYNNTWKLERVEVLTPYYSRRKTLTFLGQQHGRRINVLGNQHGGRGVTVKRLYRYEPLTLLATLEK